MQTLSNLAKHWLSTLPQIAHPYSSSPLKQDASLRKYVRVTDTQKRSFILCELDPKERFQPVITLQRAYEKAKVSVPTAINWQPPFILFEDVGDMHLKTYLESHDLSSTLNRSLNHQILTIQSMSIADIFELPTYHNLSKSKEFVDFYRLSNGHSWQAVAQEVLDMLLLAIEKLPVVPVHKDYHWENLMIQEHRLRILDYSDTMLGPPTYDLASLIADRGFYLKFSRETPELIEDMRQKLKDNGINQVDPEHFWVSIALRLFKIIGNFDRLSRDIRPSYKAYQKISIQTLKQIQWKDVLPKKWRPDRIQEISVRLSPIMEL